MFIWHRVFGAVDREVTPAEICAELSNNQVQFRPAFRGDDQGWFSARFELDGGGSLQLERFLVREERMRSELNSWCAWAETLPETAQQALALDKLVACQQIFTLFEEGEEEDARTSAACVALARWLAVRLEGIYQIDGQGFFDAAGSLLLAETSARAPA